MKLRDIFTVTITIMLAAACAFCDEVKRVSLPKPEAEGQYIPPTEQQKLWVFATNALLNVSNNARHDLMGGVEPTPANIRSWKMGLIRWWGISNQGSLLGVLDRLDKGGHRQHFDQMAKVLSGATPGQIEAMRRAYEPKSQELRSFEIVLHYKDKFGAKSILAFDYGRYISVCQTACLVGYLTEDEAWQRMMPAARLLQKTFDSWSDYGFNHLIGGEFWNTNQMTEYDSRNTYKSLGTDPASPWKTIPWDLYLGKPLAAEEKVLGANLKVYAVTVTKANNRGFSVLDIPKRTKGDTSAKHWDPAKCELMVNGGFFEKNFAPTGLYKVNNKTINRKKSRKLSGYIGINKDGALSLLTVKSDLASYSTILQAGPYLIEPGGKIGINSRVRTRARRTLIGKLKNGDLMFFNTAECRLYDLAKTLKKNFPDLDMVLNLDGGPSSAFYAGSIRIGNKVPVRNFIIKSKPVSKPAPEPDHAEDIF